MKQISWLSGLWATGKSSFLPFRVFQLLCNRLMAIENEIKRIDLMCIIHKIGLCEHQDLFSINIVWNFHRIQCAHNDL